VEDIGVSTTEIAGRKIHTEGNCWAISILNGDIWVRTDAWTLSQVELNGQILQKITTRFDPRDFFMSRLVLQWHDFCHISQLLEVDNLIQSP
jgi:hypothetical protein